MLTAGSWEQYKQFPSCEKKVYNQEENDIRRSLFFVFKNDPNVISREDKKLNDHGGQV